MTASVKIGPYKPVKPSAVRWKRSIDSFSDTAVIVLPTVSRLRDSENVSTTQTKAALAEGMAVEVRLGYDNRNTLRFAGFIKRINFTIPLEVECEGYSYRLRRISFSRSYASTTVRKLLDDLLQGTGITISPSVPEIPLTNIRFKNVNGCEVLEYLQEKCLLTCYFNFSELYVGMKYLEMKLDAVFRLGWNTVKDDDLKFQEKRELAAVRIVLEKSQLDGLKKHASSGPQDGAVKKLNIRHIVNAPALAQIADEQKRKLGQAGYEGSLTVFLEPMVEPGMVAVLESRKHPERRGRYFIESVAGEFGPNSGGRQKIGIGIKI